MSTRVLHGDCRDVLPTLEAGSVHTCVTSPPYYGLRDYGTAQWDGGDSGCDHVSHMARQDTERETPGGRGGSFRGGVIQFPHECGKCGARRIDRQIGLEATPQEWVDTLVGVMREVRRVLRDDGTAWINCGDAFRDKQLLGMPWRLAFALQADGWWLRSAIVWAKPNPMPESVTDRPTSAYEMVFLLAKQARYFYDAEAIREPHEEPWRSTGQLEQRGSKDVIAGVNRGFGLDGARPRGYNPAGRNARNVWTIATEPFPAAHFATFPPALAERCIKAGTSERGCCAQCGAPWVRSTAAEFIPQTDVVEAKGVRGAFAQKPMDASNGWQGVPRGTTQRTTTGWQPSCACGADVRPCTVLDPFGGAGTVGLVADRLQRDAVLIELNESYCDMMRDRIANDAPLLADLFVPKLDLEAAYDRPMRDLFADVAD